MSFMDRYLQLQALQQQYQQSPHGINTQPLPGGDNSSPTGNPIEAGAMAGVQAAHHSAEMNRMNKQRALGHILMNLGTRMGLPSGVPGHGINRFLDASIRAMPEGLSAYQIEAAKEQEAARKLMEHRAEQQMNALKLAAHMHESEASLGEQRRHHNAMEEVARARYPGSSYGQEIVETNRGPVDLSSYAPISTAAQKNALAKELRSFSRLSKELEHMDHDFKALEKETENNIFAPSGSILGSTPNVVKNTLARMSSNQGTGSLNKEMILRERLRTRFEQLQPLLESSLKGSAAGEQMLRRFHENQVYPTIGQPMNLIKDKIDFLKKDINEGLEKADLSLKTNHIIDHLPEQTHSSSIQEEQLEPQLSIEQQQSLIQALDAKYPKYKNNDIQEKLEAALLLKQNGRL